MLRAIALSLTCAVLALTAAACGESGSAGDADPATLVPADAPIYVEASVRPEGDLREDALAAAGKLLRTDDPAGELRELFDKALAEEGGLTWEKDFAPWLGEKAAVWATNLKAEEPSFVVIASATDTEAAGAAIERFKQQDGSAYEKRSHGGVDYEVNPEGVAGAIVDDFFVMGSEDAFKRTVETADGGDALADADGYGRAVDELEDDRLGLLFADTKLLWQAGLSADPESDEALESISNVLPFDKVGPSAGALRADGEALVIDSLSLDVPEGPLRTLSTLFGGASTELMPELPGDAWGAFAMPKVGEASQQMFDQVAGALGGAAVASQVKEATGLDLEQDVFSWIGDTGIFVHGTSEADIEGALVIQSTDDAKASAAFGKIIGLVGREASARPEPIELAGAESAFSLAVPDIPKPIVLARGAGRVVVAYGEGAAGAALDPESKLGDAELYDRAKATLGDGIEPSLLLSMASIIELADSMAGDDPDWQEFKPYLETIEAIASGGEVDGDTVKSRVAVTLK